MTRNYQRGSERHNAKLDESKVREIRLLAKGTKNAAIAAQFGVHESNIEHIVNRRT